MTVSNERLLEAIMDNRHLATERFKLTMAQGSEILTKIAGIAQSVDAMKATFDKVANDVAATVPAGHAAVLDTFIAPLDDIATRIANFEQGIAKLKSIQVPGAPGTPMAS
jgi:hypothetical protein